MKKFFLPLVILLSALLFSSCIIYVPTDGSNGTVVVENRDYRNNDYITLVEYRTRKGSWTECWNIDKNDRNEGCTFNVPAGSSYYFYIKVIYPKYLNGNDWFDEFETSETVYVGKWGKTTLVFDGDELRVR